MKKTSFIVFFIFLSIGLFAQTRFTDPVNHFSFAIPPGWYKTSKEVFDETMREIEMARGVKGSGNLLPGIQYGSSRIIKTPYIMMQIHRARMSWNEFKEEVSSLTDNDFKDIQNSFSDFLFEMSPASSYLDYEKKMFVLNIKAEVLIAGNTRGMMVMFLGRNNIVQLNIHTLEENYSQFSPDILAIINSFQFERGHEYR
jgi:hypothetical protein